MLSSDDAMRVVGIISCICCMLPILTYILFKELRNLKYVELVFYVSINDLFGTLGATLGRSQEGTFACWFQGISTNFNFISSALWTVVIAYQLYLVTHHGLLLENMFYFHLACWTIPLLATLLPLSTSTYGPGDDTISNWCVIRMTTSSAPWSDKLWIILGFYLWIWLAVSACIYFLAMVAWRFNNMGDSLAPAVLSSLHKLSFYPLIIFVCWLLPSIADMSMTFTYGVYAHSPALKMLNYISYITPLLQGILLSTVFALRNPIVRDRWKVAFAKLLLRQCACLTSNATIQHSASSGSMMTRSDSCGKRLREWLSVRGDDRINVHLRAEDESDYSSRASGMTIRSSAMSQFRKSILAIAQIGGFYDSNSGDGTNIPIPRNGTGSVGTGAGMSMGTLDTIPSAHSPPSLSGSASSQGSFGSYFASGTLPKTSDVEDSRYSGGNISAHSAQSVASSVSSTTTIVAQPYANKTFVTMGGRQGSGRLAGSPGESNFSNSPSLRLSPSHILDPRTIGECSITSPPATSPQSVYDVGNLLSESSIPDNPIFNLAAKARPNSGKR